MKYASRLSLFILLFLSSLSQSAAETVITLDDVVVTATRYEEQVSTVPAGVTVITGEDIEESSATSIPELFRTLSALHVSDITGNRRSFIVDVRGFGETAPANTLVLVDGRRVNLADLNGVDWTQIPLERIERIEIIRGGRAGVLYGDNASGGVINIITKKGNVFNGELEVNSGSYDTFSGNTFVSGTFSDMSLYLFGKYLTSDGYRDNSDTEAKDMGLNMDYLPTDSFKLNVSSGYHKDTTGLPGALKNSDFESGASRTDSLHPNDFSETEDYYFEGGPVWNIYEESFLKTDMSYRKRTFLSYASGDFGNFRGNSEIETTTLSPQVLLKTGWIAANTMTLGLDYVYTDNTIVNTSLFFGSASKGFYNLSKKNYGYYLHDEITLYDGIHLSGGYRHDKAEFTFSPSSLKDVDMRKDIYTVGINYQFHGKSYVYSSFSKSFRYPLLDELYSFFTNTVNKNLGPQSTDDYEIGMRLFFSDTTYIHIDFFRINTDDEIFFNPVTYENENLNGSTRRDGVEISCTVSPIEWLSLKGSYTYIDTDVRGDIFNGRAIPNVPKHTASFNALSSFHNGITLNVNGSYVGRRPFISDFSNSYSDQDSYFVLNSKIQYQWKALKLFLTVNNITDEEYSEYGVLGGFPLEKAFYPSPERNFLAGVAFGF